jgi:DHA1 family bicyclomycin/chloramphenicol resistance-like MFS transporter
LLAPLIGSVLLDAFGWRGTFAALLAWGILSLVVVWFQLPETLPAERRGQLPLGRAFAVYARLLADPVAIGLLLAGGMSFAAMFAYITASPFYFIELQKFSPRDYGLLFAANALGIFAANYANSRLVRQRGAAVMAGVGSLTGCLGALVVLLAIAIPDALPAVIGGLFMVVGMTGLLGANCVGLLMARYPENAGAAAALFGASQFGLGMLASAGVSYWHDGSGLPMAWMICLTTAASVFGYLLFRLGTRHGCSG